MIYILGEDTMSFKRLLHRMWFALYPRSRRTKGSCAFEHVFLGEVKNGKVNGFHNWLFFLLEEQKGTYALSSRFLRSSSLFQLAFNCSNLLVLRNLQ